MDRLAIWPFSTPMDSSGTMIDEFQGIYSRGLCRAFTEALLRTRFCDVAVCLPIVTIGEVTSWAVMGKEWNLDRALEVQLPVGVGLMTLGTVSIAKQVELHVLLVSHTQSSLLLDRQFGYPRAQLLTCLSEAVVDIAARIVGRPLTNDEKGEGKGDSHQIWIIQALCIASSLPSFSKFGGCHLQWRKSGQGYFWLIRLDVGCFVDAEGMEA